MEARLKVKVVPGASRSSLGGWLGDSLKVRVSAPPEKGKANAAVISLLAKELQLDESALSILSGGTSPHKVIGIKGKEISAILQALDAKVTVKDE